MITAAVNIWTDGACSGNPGPMGIGVVVVDGPDRREAGVGLGDGTSNIAELRAIEHGLVLAAELTGDKTRPMRVHSDSAYAIGILSKGWKAKANVDLVARLRLMLADFPNVTFVKVRGHAGVVENERCDELATAATAGFSVPVVTGHSTASVAEQYLAARPKRSLEYLFREALKLLEQASHPSAGGAEFASCRLFLSSREVRGALARLSKESS